MERSLSKLFLNRGFFYVVIAAAVIGQIAQSILLNQVIGGIISVIAEIVLIYAYFKENKKLITYLSSITLVLIGANSVVWLVAINPIDRICGIAYLLLVIGFAISHFMILTSKEKIGRHVAVNQLHSFVILMVLIIWNAISISSSSAVSSILGYAFEVLSLAGAFFLFACCETLLKKLK